ncbi:MAG: GyrI-like domain-containing protein [Chloroflexota bacterium]|nr:GyrI-like domain-containing protein [Chloroflexota bacterium]
MNKSEVGIVNLEPLRVARFHGFGEEPEDIVWQKLTAWAEPRDLLDYTPQHRIFGFNNPNPAPGSPNYGYEFWITVTSEETAGEDVEIVEFPGGLYAIARAAIRNDAYEVIGDTWKQLVAWREQSAYHSADHQWLEEHICVAAVGTDFDLDLYLPIAE